MGKNYTISAVSPGPKEWQSKYGTMLTYRVKLEGETDVIEINKKPESPAPEKGQEIFGHIEETEYGKKFKSETQGFAPQPKREYVDHSDGQRQGMCINNAANYVAATSGKLEAIEWAETVHQYATALYILGDLNQTSGYDKAKATANQIKANREVDTVIEDIGDEPINIDDIPF